MRQMLDKPYIRLPLYSVWGALVFALALGATFPDDELKEIVIVQAESALGFREAHETRH